MTAPTLRLSWPASPATWAVHQAPNSRYLDIPTAELALPDGSTLVYLRRRFLPQPERLADLGTVTVLAGHRIDTLAADVFGDPTLFWRLADANLAFRPADLVAEPGRVLWVASTEGLPGGPGA